MNQESRDEIAASVAAHAELGARYDDAVAEGLVERIGAEIDKRVEARLRGLGGPSGQPGIQPPYGAASPVPPPAPASPQGPLAPSVQHALAHRSGGATFAGVLLAFGSMGLGVGATAVLASHVHNSFAQVVTILLVWVAIVMVNGVHARFYWPEGNPPRRGK